MLIIVWQVFSAIHIKFTTHGNKDLVACIVSSISSNYYWQVSRNFIRRCNRNNCHDQERDGWKLTLKTPKFYPVYSKRRCKLSIRVGNVPLTRIYYVSYTEIASPAGSSYRAKNPA